MKKCCQDSITEVLKLFNDLQIEIALGVLKESKK